MTSHDSVHMEAIHLWPGHWASVLDFPDTDFHITLKRIYTMQEKPKIVCLCGSTRFKDAFINANRDETLKGNVVLSVGMFGHQEGLDMEGEVKKRLDRLHFYKIGLSDEILVLDVDGYIGESTRNEINYARSIGRHIRFLSEETGTMVPQDGGNANG